MNKAAASDCASWYRPGTTRGSFEEFSGYADVLWPSTACSDRVNEDWLATGDVACFLGCTFSSIIENALHGGKKKEQSL